MSSLVCKNCNHAYRTESRYRSHNCKKERRRSLESGMVKQQPRRTPTRSEDQLQNVRTYYQNQISTVEKNVHKQRDEEEELRYQKLKAKYNEKLNTFYQELLQTRKALKQMPLLVKEKEENVKKEVQRHHQKQRLDMTRVLEEKEKHLAILSNTIQTSRQEIIRLEATIIEHQEHFKKERQQIISQTTQEAKREKDIQTQHALQLKQAVISNLQKTQASLEEQLARSKEQATEVVLQHQQELHEAKLHFAEEIVKIRNNVEKVDQVYQTDIQAQLAKQKTELAIQHQESINQYKQQIKNQQQTHYKTLAELQQKNTKLIQSLQDSSLQDLNKLQAQLRDTKIDYEAKLTELRQQYEALKTQSDAQFSYNQKQISQLSGQLKKQQLLETEWQATLEMTKKEYETKLEELTFSFEAKTRDTEKRNKELINLQEQMLENQQQTEVNFEKIIQERTIHFINNLNQQTKQLEEQKNQYEITLKTLQAQNERLSTESVSHLNSLQAQYEQALSYSRSLKEKIEEEQMVNKRLVEEIKTLKQTNSTSQTATISLQMECQEAQTKVSQIRNQLEITKQREQDLVKQLQTKETQISMLNKGLEQVKTAVEEQYKEKLKAQLEASTREKQFFQSTVDNLKQEYTKLQKTTHEQELTTNINKNNYETELTKLRNEIKEKGTSTDERDKQLSQLQHQHNVLADQSRKTILYLQEQLEKVNNDYKQKMEEHKHTETHSTNLLTKLRKDASQQVIELKEQHALQINQVKLAATASQASLQERQKQVDTLQTEVVKLSTELKTMQIEYQHRVESVEKRQKKLDLEKEQLKNTPPKLLDPSLKESRDKLMAELRTSRVELGQTREQVIVLKSQLEQTNREKDGMVESKEELKKRVQELEKILLEKLNRS